MTSEQDDLPFAGAIQRALAARDARLRVPAFSATWPSENRRARAFGWRIALATAATVAAVGIVSWTLLRAPAAVQQEAFDPLIAQELSRPDYWRVPSDELLALAAPPLEASLPSGGDFSVSLEESYL